MKKLFLSLLIGAAILPAFAFEVSFEKPEEGDPNENYVQTVLDEALRKCAYENVTDQIKLHRMQQLLDAGANPNAYGKENDVLFRCISRNRSLEIIQLLLNRNALPTGSHLCEAAAKGNLTLCKILVEKGVLVDAQDSSKTTALACAAQKADMQEYFKKPAGSYKDICLFLLGRGASENISDAGALNYLKKLKNK